MNALLTFVQNPAASVASAMDRRDISMALLGYIAGTISIALMLALESGRVSGVIGFSFGVLFSLIFNLTIGFFFSATAHMFLDITSGKSKAAGLFVLLGLSGFIQTLFVALALISLAVPVVSDFRALFVLVIFALQLCFILVMMRSAYGVSKAGTFFALALSVFSSGIGAFFASIIFLISIFWFILK